MVTKQITFRLTDNDLAVLDAAQARAGLLTRSETFRMVLRQYARTEGIELPKPKARKTRAK